MPVWPDVWAPPLRLLITDAFKDVRFQSMFFLRRSFSSVRSFGDVLQELLACASLLPRIRSCKKILLMPPDIEEVDHITESMVAMNKAARHSGN